MKAEASDNKEPITFDVVVVGSGFAGLVAAAEAAKRGNSVVVLEKMNYFGGNSRTAGGGYCCFDSKLKLREKLGLGQDSWQAHYEDTLKAGGYYNVPQLVEILAKEAPSGLDLLVDAGIPFRESLPRIGGHSAYRSYQMACSGKEAIDILKAECLKSGSVMFQKGVSVCGILRKAGDAVTGVEVLQGNRKETILAKRAVIIASGGYGRDVQLRSAHKPTLTDSYNCSNHKGATGEMIRYAKAIGADTLHMEFIQLYPCANPKNGGVDQPAFLCYSGTGYGLVYVDGEGRRFVNELASRETVATAQIEAGGNPTYSLLNDTMLEKLGIDPKDFITHIERGRVFCADSLEELAEHVGFDEAILRNNIASHNHALETGCDSDFGKPVTSQMIPLTSGKYYAIPQWPSVHYSMGGLRIDAKARVIDIGEKPIPGLYAAGEVCGGIHGNDRLGGNAIAECIVFGRIAGSLQ